MHSSEASNRCQAPLEALGLVAHVFMPIDLTYVCLPSDITCRRRVVNACIYEHNTTERLEEFYTEQCESEQRTIIHNDRREITSWEVEAAL